MSITEPLRRVHFEVFGKVQGVFFRKHTKLTADKLKLTGWCMNTPTRTVKGEIEGASEAVDQMKHWLQYTGSPMCRIDKTVFHDDEVVTSRKFESFTVVR